MKYLIIILFTCYKFYGQTDSTAVDHFLQRVEENNNKLITTKYPNFYLKNDKGVITNEKLIGKITFINVWTEFCAPCIAEMNSLNKLYEKHKDNKKFAFISLTSDDENMIKSATKQYNIKYNIYNVTRKEIYKLNLNNGFPTSIIVDAQGKIHFIKSGGFSDPIKADEMVLKEIEPIIDSLLKN
jgi:thiol-disulfide isomerase/thioredoxin